MLVGRRIPLRGKRPVLEAAAVTVSRPNMGDFSAMVVGAPKGVSAAELWRQGMAGMGDAGGNWLNTLTGGAVADVSAKLDRVELALKISTAAAIGSALLSLWLATRRR